MNMISAQNGSRIVYTNNQNTAGIYESRLYVSKGETATPTCARHKTLAGAKKWASRVVSK